MPEGISNEYPTEDEIGLLTPEEISNLKNEIKERGSKSKKEQKKEQFERDLTFAIVLLHSALEERDFHIDTLDPDAKKHLTNKLRYYLQKNKFIWSDLNIPTLADAIVDFPDFFTNENFGIKGLLEAHARKILLEIAERKKQNEKSGRVPYEALFETESGEYYMARLTDIQHLQDESNEMRNCVGESKSYLNRIKKGKIEILSFRRTPKFNQELGMFEKDEPLLTIEYDPETRTIKQIKKYMNQTLDGNEAYISDFIEALERLNETKDDKDEAREVKEISKWELNSLKVDDYHVYTKKGSVHFSQYNQDDHGFILKNGEMPIDESVSKEDAVKIFKFTEGIDVKESEIAYKKEEVGKNTKLYIGELYPDIFKELPNDIEHVYTDFPHEKIEIFRFSIPEKARTLDEYKEELKKKDFILENSLEFFLRNNEYLLKEGINKNIRLAKIQLRSLSFNIGTAENLVMDKLKELKLDNIELPILLAIELRLNLKEESMHEEILITIKPIEIDGEEYDSLIISFDEKGHTIWPFNSHYRENDQKFYTSPIIVQI